MKIFNVSLRVQIHQIAELPDNPANEPASTEHSDLHALGEDPLDKQDRILNKYMDRIEKNFAAPPRVFMGMPGEMGDGASFAKNVKIVAESYEDMAAILKLFSDVANKLHPVPDSLLSGAPDPRVTPMGPF